MILRRFFLLISQGRRLAGSRCNSAGWRHPKAVGPRSARPAPQVPKSRSLRRPRECVWASRIRTPQRAHTRHAVDERGGLARMSLSDEEQAAHRHPSTRRWTGVMTYEFVCAISLRVRDAKHHNGVCSHDHHHAERKDRLRVKRPGPKPQVRATF